MVVAESRFCETMEYSSIFHPFVVRDSSREFSVMKLAYVSIFRRTEKHK